MPISAEIFWSKVNIAAATECWLWGGSMKSNGYGRIKIHYRETLAHRLAYELAHGDCPPNFCVCHSCDNPRCCNPSHLFLGTQADNMADMIAKGRSRTPVGTADTKGGKNGFAKLTLAQVIEIRSFQGKISHSDLAKKFGVGRSTVGAIQSRQRWQHVA